MAAARSCRRRAQAWHHHQMYRPEQGNRALPDARCAAISPSGACSQASRAPPLAMAMNTMGSQAMAQPASPQGVSTRRCCAGHGGGLFSASARLTVLGHQAVQPVFMRAAPRSCSCLTSDRQLAGERGRRQGRCSAGAVRAGRRPVAARRTEPGWRLR